MVAVILSVLYFIEILKYYLAYEFLYGEKLKKYFLPVAGFAVSLIMMFIMIHGKEALLFLLMYFLCCALLLLCKEARCLKELRG